MSSSSSAAAREDSKGLLFRPRPEAGPGPLPRRLLAAGLAAIRGHQKVVDKTPSLISSSNMEESQRQRLPCSVSSASQPAHLRIRPRLSNQQPTIPHSVLPLSLFCHHCLRNPSPIRHIATKLPTLTGRFPWSLLVWFSMLLTLLFCCTLHTRAECVWTAAIGGSPSISCPSDVPLCEVEQAD